jgi:hypothetical protein
LAGLGSVFTGPLTGNSLTHWWVEIETCTSGEGEYFILQFDGNEDVTLKECPSIEDITTAGKRVVNAHEEFKNITVKYDWCPQEKYMGDVFALAHTYVESYGQYHLIRNNCHHLSERFYVALK